MKVKQIRRGARNDEVQVVRARIIPLARSGWNAPETSAQPSPRRVRKALAHDASHGKAGHNARAPHRTGILWLKQAGKPAKIIDEAGPIRHMDERPCESASGLQAQGGRCVDHLAA